MERLRGLCADINCHIMREHKEHTTTDPQLDLRNLAVSDDEVDAVVKALFLSWCHSGAGQPPVTHLDEILWKSYRQDDAYRADFDTVKTALVLHRLSLLQEVGS